jgi:site-specific recombinase XerD
MVRLLLDTGVRASELMGLAVEDVDLEQGLAVVLGKGRRARSVPFGTKTAQDLGRYLRGRRTHPMAASPALFIGRKGPLGDSGLREVLDRRCADAGSGT